MIEIKGLVKKFGDFTAVDGLDLRIETGEFFGLLGPNGAGKTTTISMLSTVLLPTSGEIYIDGQKLDRKASSQKRKLSVITQEYSMRQDMTRDEVMEYQGRLYYMSKKEIKEKSEGLLEFAGLSELAVDLSACFIARKSLDVDRVNAVEDAAFDGGIIPLEPP